MGIRWNLRVITCLRWGFRSCWRGWLLAFGIFCKIRLGSRRVSTFISLRHKWPNRHCTEGTVRSSSPTSSSRCMNATWRSMWRRPQSMCYAFTQLPIFGPRSSPFPSPQPSSMYEYDRPIYQMPITRWSPYCSMPISMLLVTLIFRHRWSRTSDIMLIIVPSLVYKYYIRII